MNQQAEQIFQSAQEMMLNLQSVRGEEFARTVEITLQMIKMKDLIGTLLKHVETAVEKEKLNEIWQNVQMVCAHVVGLSAMNADLIGKIEPAELVEWAEKILELEYRGVEAMDD